METKELNLAQARREIDAVDAELAALFERRMEAVLAVAEYKRAHGLPIYDAAREAVVLEQAAARIHTPALRPYYASHVQNLMDVAKQYEAFVLGQNRAAYQGVEGAFAHIALKALFPHAEAVNYPTWEDVFEAVERGDAAHGVVPFENSHAGDVSAVLDLCYNHPDLWVVNVYDLPISQNLLVLPGVQLHELRDVYSHQQAIAQSETFLKGCRLPAHAMANTAMAAKYVSEAGDRTKAAIASRETADLYGLEVLVPNINADGDNTTRFIVLSREKPTAGNRFSLLFTVDNKPGKLAEVIQKIGASGFNMESIKSRPMPHVPFEYYFYVELVGDPAEAATAALLEELDRTCRTVRMLGVYTK
jgi:chorismate mutase/prephenate dehydratase